MAAKKKYKIFKICKELNLGHDTINAFLEQSKLEVMGSGVNGAVSEETYLKILDKFSTDKDKADAIRKRRQADSGPQEESVVEESAETEEQSSGYLDQIKQSIEQGAKAIERGEDIKPEKKKRVVRKKKAVPEEPVADEVAKPTVEEQPAEVTITKEAESSEPETAETAAEVKEVVTGEVEDQTKKQTEAETTSEKETDKTSKKGKKTKEKKKTAHKESDEQVSEKKKKHRKAIEMIRKDKGARHGVRLGDIAFSDGQPVSGRKKKNRKQKKNQVDIKEVQNNVKKTLANIETKKKPKKHRKVKTETGEIIEEKVIQVTEFISVHDLAGLMDVSVSEIITKCLELGLVVSINQRLDIDTITLLAEEYDYAVEEQFATDFVDEEDDDDDEDESKLQPRAPIVTIMGHVDHGKTSLLDYLRKSHIVDGESGGITQHIGAYEVDYNGKKITFLDTPGHEAFTAMRARGAQATDIVILIIAADDAVMPQTVEALDHARAAGVKIVIAINKIDKPGANPERIRQQLADRDVLLEDWGGTYQSAEISAKTGQGIPELLEKVILEAEMLDLKANPDRRAQGVVVESRLDKGRGAIATVLIQKGTLKVGDNFIAGHYYGKVRAMFDEHDKRIKSVGPSQPALIVGFMGVPQAGDRFTVMKDEKSARELSSKRQQLKREQEGKQVKMMTLAQISEQIKKGVVTNLPVLVKADVDGSAEALADSLINLNTDEVQVNIIRKAVGPISESDVLLASASGALIIGFHVRANAKARELAEKENVDIRIYRVIYDAINELKLAMEGMLAPSLEESVIGQAEIRELFKISRIGTIAGCHVISGKIIRKNKIRLIREDVEIYTGNIASLKRIKDDVREVASGFDCGIQIENYNDLKIGDIIESFEVSEVKRKLE